MTEVRETIDGYEDSDIYTVDEYSISPKKWIRAEMKIPQAVEHVYGRSTRFDKVNNNQIFNTYRSLYSSVSVRVRLGGQPEYEGRHYINIPFGQPLTAVGILKSGDMVVIGSSIPLVQLGALSELHEDKDPNKKFLPSRALVELVRKHMIPPDTEISYIVNELKKVSVEVGDEIQNMSCMVTEQVEGLFTKIAKIMYRTGIPIKISMGNRFTPEVCTELIRRLGLDPLDPGPVLKLLYTEIFPFVSEIARARSWGKINLEGSNIKLFLREDAFKFPKLSEIDVNDRWV